MSLSQACVALVLLNLTAGAVRLAAQAAPPSPPGTSASASPAPGPMIEFTEKDYNWGKVEAGEVVKHVFIVSNAGTANLLISNVHPSCGCTTAGDWTKTPIEPGKTGTIPVQFNSARYSSSVPLTKAIDVYSNAKNHPHDTVFLRGLVHKSIEVTPPSPIISVVADSTNNVSTTVHITCQADQAVELSDAVSSSKSFAADLQTVKPGKEYKLVITALPPFVVGSSTAAITLKTTLSNTPTLDVNVIANIQPEIQVSPPQLRIGILPNVWTTNRGVFVRGNGPSALTLSDPESSDPRIQVRLNPIGVQGMYNLLVALPPNYQVEAGHPVEISVKSNNPRMPVVKIPVVQFARGTGTYSGLPAHVSHSGAPPAPSPTTAGAIGHVVSQPAAPPAPNP